MEKLVIEVHCLSICLIKPFKVPKPNTKSENTRNSKMPNDGKLCEE